MHQYTIRDARPGEEEAITRIVSSVLQEYGFNIDLEGIDSDLIDIVASYTDGGGLFRVIVDADDTIVGCAGLFALKDGEVELRKMYLLPHARGYGMGRALLEELIDCARTMGFTQIVLETADVLQDAIALYRRNGFVEIDRVTPGCRCDRVFMLELHKGINH